MKRHQETMVTRWQYPMRILAFIDIHASSGDAIMENEMLTLLSSAMVTRMLSIDGTNGIPRASSRRLEAMIASSASSNSVGCKGEACRAQQGVRTSPARSRPFARPVLWKRTRWEFRWISSAFNSQFEITRLAGLFDDDFESGRSASSVCNPNPVTYVD
jgi:hypothetical protein